VLLLIKRFMTHHLNCAPLFSSADMLEDAPPSLLLRVHTHTHTHTHLLWQHLVQLCSTPLLYSSSCRGMQCTADGPSSA